jgi:hypothetical protein
MGTTASSRGPSITGNPSWRGMVSRAIRSTSPRASGPISSSTASRMSGWMGTALSSSGAISTTPFSPVPPDTASAASGLIMPRGVPTSAAIFSSPAPSRRTSASVGGAAEGRLSAGPRGRATRRNVEVVTAFGRLLFRTPPRRVWVPISTLPWTGAVTSNSDSVGMALRWLR